MKARASLFAAIAVFALAGCKDVGLPDRNLPIEQAAHRPPDALVQAVYPELAADTSADAHPADGASAGMTGDANAVQVGEQTFVASGTPVRIPDGALEEIGSSGGASFHAVKGDDAPYDRLYMAHEDRYVEYMPVHEQGDPVARRAALEENLEAAPAH